MASDVAELNSEFVRPQRHVSALLHAPTVKSIGKRIWSNQFGLSFKPLTSNPKPLTSNPKPLTLNLKT